MCGSFQPTYEIGEETFRKALRHGMELWYDDSSPLQDWGKGVKKEKNERSFTKFVADRIEGKLGEAGFQAMLRTEFDIESKIDWDIYGDISQTDSADLKCLVQDGIQYPPAEPFDVKKTKPRNLWLAIRHSIWQSHGDTDPIILTQLELPERPQVDQWRSQDEFPTNDEGLEETIQQWSSANLPVEVRITGYVEKQNFTDFFSRGERLYHPDGGYTIGPRLKTDNKGIPVQDLRSSREAWNSLVERIVGDNPINWTPA